MKVTIEITLDERSLVAMSKAFVLTVVVLAGLCGSGVATSLIRLLGGS